MDKIWSEDGADCGAIEAEPEYASMTDEAVSDLALRIVRRQVFGSWQIDERSPITIEQCFIFLLLMDDIDRRRLLRDGINHLWEDLSEAAPMTVNGYPIFYSGYCLTDGDFKRVMTKVRDMEDRLI